MKRLSAKILAPLAISLTFFTMAAPLVAHAQADTYGLDQTANASGVFKQDVTVKKSLPTLVGDILGVALSLVGLVFLGYAVYGGFRWMTARGDSKSVTEGRETLIDASIGIVLVLSAYIVTNYLFTTITPALNTAAPGAAASSTP